MSFHEKSLWLLFSTLGAVFALYFWLALTALPRAGDQATMAHAGLFMGLVVLLTVIQIFGNILLALAGKLTGSMDGRVDTDERDQLIELKGARNGSLVLATGVFCSLSAALVTNGNFVFMHLLLGFWVAAQLVETGTQLFFYRRGF